MIISGFQKLTLLDYPDYLACIIFTQGCNFNCPFCQNSPLIEYPNDLGIISEQEIIDYLEKRKNVLDGVVISGGEPTIQKNLKTFIKRIKELGLKVKLDTNGFNPKILEELLNEKLLDYVAMDIKNDLKNYGKTSGIIELKLDNILKSIDLIKNSKIDYEFRTTIMKEYHSVENIENILSVIGDCKYYIQNFKDSENVLDKNIHGFSDEELEEIQNHLNIKYKNVKVRGLYKEKVGGEVYV